MKSRIAPIDGLRAYAVLGVIWAHAWTEFKHPVLKIWRVDINKIISFGGVGVDLFFVISGFCMYLMYQKKAKTFNIPVYRAFIFKRWKRIAPAFYVVVSFECILYLILHGHFPFSSFIAHLFFANTFISDNVLSPPFWSLSTEWQFYLVLPLLFINDPLNKKGYLRISLLMILCLIFRLILFYQHAADLRTGSQILHDKIWFRFIEFGWGMIAAKLYIAKKSLPGFLLGFKGFVLAFCIAMVGRSFLVVEVYQSLGSYAFIMKAFGEPVLTFGFALVVLNVIESRSIFSRFLSLPFMQFLGKISYSMYLWHWMIVVNVCSWWIGLTHISVLNLNIAFLITVLIVVLIAYLSYRLFEAPYFQAEHKGKDVVNPSPVTAT